MYLGIDLGTSSIKVVLMDGQQQIIASSSSALKISRPQPLWSEQDPLEWWHATQAAILNLKKNHGQHFKNLRAIGLSGQMHGATLLNNQDQVLRPAMLWNDGRAIAQCHTLIQRVPEALNITGNLIMPGFTAPKVLWVAEHEASIFKKIAKVLLPKDYLRLQITGVYASDMSDASGTMWLDVGNRQWSTDMINATGLQEKQLPELFEGSEITAIVLPAIAKQWGIPDNTVVIAGGGDNAASAISMGIIEVGQAFLSIGTSGVYFVADDQFRPNPQEALHTMCHCLPARWHQMSVHLSSASCLQWVGKVINQHDTHELIALAEQHNPNYTPIFLPYLSGERTPHNNPQARGALVGLTDSTGAAELIQAVLEGIGFAFAQGQQVIYNAGVTVKELAVIGGGARSKYWGEILATILHKTLTYRHQAEIGAAYGAARLAWFAIHGGSLTDAFPKPAIEHIIEPITENFRRYQHNQQLFNQLYDQLKPSFLMFNKELPL